MAEGLGSRVMFSHAERSPANGQESDAVEWVFSDTPVTPIIPAALRFGCVVDSVDATC